MGRRSFAVFVAAVLLFGQVATVFAAGVSPGAGPAALAAARVQGGLLATLEAGTVDRFVVEFAGKANSSGAAKLKAKVQKGQFVLDALNATANAAQGPAAGIARGIKGIRYTTYWLTNVGVVDVAPGAGKAAAALATRLAKLDGVTAVRAEKVFPLVEPVNGARPITPNVEENGLAPEWGVSKIGAPAAWAGGVTGSGIVVANIDTGVDYLHDALISQYRGNLGGGTFDHDFAWFDPTGICGATPCDNAQHGTHTMGTVVGGDGEGPYTPDTGVAPGATWIAAKGCEDLGCSEQALLSSGQWMIAPTEIGGDLEDGDPAKAPDIINNSWGSGPNDPFYLATVQAWRAAGIIPVFIGNPGPFCGEGGSPGDFLEVISVGATDIDDLIADFSGRGPSSFKDHNPDVAAPGVDVTSTIPGGGFAAFNGTSMAAPHVTGTLALMLQADAALRGNFDGSAQILKQTAFDIIDESCGPEGGDGDPNNVYGDGRIDAALAVQTVKDGGTLSGTVLDFDSDLPIAGARVVASAGSRDFPATTDADGNYSLFLAAGEYSVSASAFGYNGGFVGSVVIITDTVTDVDFDLVALPRFTISGTITAVENGDPIEGARVKVTGTPLAPAFTNASGDYTISNVPIGEYDLRVTANGCAESTTIENVIGSVEGEIVDADAALVRKLDDFGHGCGPIPFDWVEAEAQTALYGDEIGGRLRLPFTFPFYGEDYSEVWLAENGYVNFEGFDAGNFIPSEIPSGSFPNGAIYPLWQDLSVFEGSINHQTIGTAPDRAFVIEYDAELFGTATAVHVEMKLWEDGTIDFLYGNNPINANGSQATVGIENAAGTDALQVTFLEDVLEDNSAIRIETVPVGFVAGTVTDANDGLPVAGATVTAQPGGRDAVTDEDGLYNLVLRPGLYSITISAPGYVSQTTPGVDVQVGATDTVNAALESPTAAVAPTEIVAAVGFGETTTVPVTITNDGSALLTWEVKERNIGSTPVPLPEPGIAARRTPTYREHPLPAGVTRTPIRPLAVDDLPIIIDDPDDDSTGAIETTAVRGLSDGTAASVAIEYAAGSPLNAIGGNIYFDTDQDPTTGLPPDAFFGLPTQDIGFDYWAELFSLAGPEPEVPIFSVELGDLVAVVPAEVTATSISFAVPLEAIGGDDGLIDLALDNGTLGPEDWAPDEGHGTIQSFSDVPWISSDPESGETAPDGGVSNVDITLGSADLEPGTHEAQVVFVTNAPRSRMVAIDVTLDVGLPAEFGAVTGVVTDAHTTAPIEGASVVLHGEWPPTTPRDFTATTGEDGAYRIVGPPGTWDVTVSALGYEDGTIQATIASGVSTPGADAALHLDVPHADLAGGDVSVTLLPGGSTQRSLLLGNPGGHEPLTFEIGEVDLSGVGVTAAGAFALPADADRSARTTRGLGLRPAIVPAGVQDTVAVLAEWPTGLGIPWGVGYDGSVWLSDVVDPFEGCGGAGACLNADFTTGGEPIATVPADWSAVFNGDMAFDPVRNRMWQINIDFDGGDNGIVGWDLATGEALDTITGAAFATTSQRGVAYDADTDTFYVGGWNEGVIYHVAGLDHPSGPGTVLDECSPDDPNISGLAWNPAFDLLWMSTNSDTDSIFLIDPVTCEAQNVLAHPDGGGFGGAGLEMDVVGNLWTVGQNSGNAYLLESGLPNFVDAPWLSVSPTEGTVEPDATQELELTIDATGLDVGIYRALVVVQTNDPDNRTITREITLTVTDYLRGINAGGAAHTDANGFVWSADQRWRSNNPNSFGYVGGGDTRSTNQTIAGTVEQGLFRNLREDMDGYRFSGLASGLYQVDLHFADLQSTRVGQKIFDILLEGTAVYSDLDVFAVAGGRRVALSMSFIVEVTDGHLDIEFNPDEDDEAIVNAILVTHLP